jgi:serine/threonine protein kinase
VAKIADFGVSTCLESDLLTHHAAGTLAFMAPEVRRYFLGEDVSYDATADIWSLGALAVAMLTGNPEPRVATRPRTLHVFTPPDALDVPDLTLLSLCAAAAVEEVVDELRELGLSDKSVALVERTLQRQPEKRPALADLMASTYPAKARL